LDTYKFHNIYSIFQLLFYEEFMHVVKKYSKVAGSVPIWNKNGYFLAGFALLRAMAAIDHSLVFGFNYFPF
jgi:hypothetical protein